MHVCAAEISNLEAAFEVSWAETRLLQLQCEDVEACSALHPLLSLRNEKQTDGFGKSNYKNKYVYFQFISPPIPVCAPHKPWHLS